MLTGKTPEREFLARAAVNCFLRQSYANRELVIVNHGQEPLNIVHPMIREVKLEDPGPKRKTIGELRNIGLENAKGDWVIQWDDDDYHHIHRIVFQMAHRRGNAAVMLKWMLRVNLISSDAFPCGDPVACGGSMLFPKSGAVKPYPDVSKHEDTVFWTSNWGTNYVVVDNNSASWPGPALYLRLFHGVAPTTDEAHFMAEAADCRNMIKESVNGDQVEYIKEVLQEYGVATRVTETVPKVA
jgi:glycosyltransferase involved in cell wall biosynthesis